MTRRELREHCFKLLFCAEFYPEGETKEQIEQYFMEPREDDYTAEGAYELIHCPELDVYDSGYVKNKVEKVMAAFPELDQAINEAAEGWNTKRMGKVELTILRLALFEIRYDEEIPDKVAINEAVELAKKFGGDESPSFVNGVLARLVK